MRIRRYVLFGLCCCIAAAFLFGGCRRNDAKQRTVAQLDDLNSPRYVIGGMTGIAATDEAKKAFPKAKFLEYSMPIDGFTALTAGKLDAMVLDRPTLEFMAVAHPELTVMPQDLAVGHISAAVAKKNGKLLRQVNDFIRRYRADGTYQAMCRRWFRTKDADMPEIPSPEKIRGPLKVGITANNEPLCFLKNAELAGFDTEFSLRLGAFLGKKVEFFDMPYDALVMALESGRIDIAVAYMDAVPEREESVGFSENYIDSPISVIVRKNLLKNKKFSGVDKLSDIDVQDCSLVESFKKTFIREKRWKLILQGLGTTLVITVFAVLLGTVLAFPICIMSRSRRKIFSFLAERYVSVIMGTPILVILMILYYVIFAKVDISGVLVAILAFALDFAAYTSVTLRSGIDGIPRGQMEAALALGHTPFAAFMRFVLPQAVRTILPVYRGEIISTLKSTSIVGYIAIMDLTKMGDIIRSRTYEAFFPLIAIALIYFLTAKGLTALLMIAEHRLDPDIRRVRMQNRGVK